MHIYYYYKDGYYFVMNEKGVLEKYSVKNNIEMILKLENIIQYFTENLEEENTKFYFKPYQELTPIEKTNFLQIISMFSLFQYTIFQENIIPVLTMETAIFNIVDKIYEEKKTRTQKEEGLFEDIYIELLAILNSELELLKQISGYQKEIVPLSELDEKANKIYINQDEEIDTYCTYVDIQYDANLKMRNRKYQLIMYYATLITNGIITLASSLWLIKEYINITNLNNSLSSAYNKLTLLALIGCYIYEKAKEAEEDEEEDQEIEEPTLKLKKEK